MAKENNGTKFVAVGGDRPAKHLKQEIACLDRGDELSSAEKKVFWVAMVVAVIHQMSIRSNSRVIDFNFRENVGGIGAWAEGLQTSGAENRETEFGDGVWRFLPPFCVEAYDYHVL